MRLGATLALFLAALVAGCNTNYPNPFENGEGTKAATPAPDAALALLANGYAPEPGHGRELFAVAATGSDLSRLTFCNESGAACDTLEAAFAPDRERAIVRRVLQDTDGDGRLTDADAAALVYVDLKNQVEAILVAADQRVTGADWSPVPGARAADEILVYSAQGDGGEDLFKTTPVRPTANNAQQTLNLTCPPGSGTAPVCDDRIRERRPRIDPTGNFAVFERIDATGKGRIFVFQSSSSMIPVTSGGPGTEPLAGTPYVVGSDADPAYSPDGQSAVFRRLASTGNGGRGAWDVMTVRIDGSSLDLIASGPLWRGAPDWGADGIVFPEQDAATGAVHLVLIQPDGSGRREVVSLAPGFSLDAPRWLPR
jgi:hypothetical protein